MSSTLVMSGLENLEGRQFGKLRAVRMVKRHPEPVYATRCEQCNAESTATHRRLQNGAAVCRNATCGKSVKPTGRDLVREQKRIAAEREAEAERSAVEAAAARMTAETADWERPERYTPAPEPRVMTERERISLREFHEAEEAAQREADRPRLEAERRQQERIAELLEEQQNALRQLHAIERERVANGRDDQFSVDPATTTGAGVPVAELDAWHAAQSTQFLADNPQYLRCPENEATIFAYLQRNAPGLKLLSAAQLTAAYRRLRDFGLLKERPAPQPKPGPQHVSAPAQKRTTPPKPVDDGSETGVDWTTGQPLTLTAKQVAALSADDYRRFKKLDRAALELPQFPSNRYAR